MSLKQKGRMEMQRFFVWLLLILVGAILVACDGQASKGVVNTSTPGFTNANQRPPKDAELSDVPSQTRPNKFAQVVATNGAIQVQVFDKWVNVYLYSSKDYEMAGIATEAKTHVNEGDIQNPKLGDLVAEAKLVPPRDFKYPRMPTEIQIEETHLTVGDTTFKGRMTFAPISDASRLIGSEKVSGHKSNEYYPSWPFYNYRIERRMTGDESMVFTITLNPE